MIELRKPKIGLLGLMTGGYEPIFPGINQRQINYAMEIVEKVSPVVDVVFNGLGSDRDAIERIVREYNEADLDGILIILLTYSNGSYLLRALENNRLPIGMAVVQPDQVVGDDWDELRLTVNQGIHGAQDNANMIVRSGYKCEFFAGNRHEQRFVDWVEDFGKACYTRKRLKGMRTGVLSRMCGMADILTDDMKFMHIVGPEFCNDTAGSIYSRMETVTKEQIDEQIAKDYAYHDVDPKLTYESHAEAVRMYLAFKQWLDDKGYLAYTAQFDQFSDDGRFKQLPLYAASNLMADGYGYAAEGDSMCASMVLAAHTIGDNNGNFTEMYTMDYEKQAIIFCHAGEGNWATHRKDMKPKLIDRYLGEGGLANPPTHIFTPEYGPATLTSLVALEGGKFRLVVAQGQMLPKSDMQNCEMPYFFWKPDSGLENCIEGWLRAGGTHHEVINIGDVRRRWKMWCNMCGIEYVEV